MDLLERGIMVLLTLTQNRSRYSIRNCMMEGIRNTLESPIRGKTLIEFMIFISMWREHSNDSKGNRSQLIPCEGGNREVDRVSPIGYKRSFLFCTHSLFTLSLEYWPQSAYNFSIASALSIQCNFFFWKLTKLTHWNGFYDIRVSTHHLFTHTTHTKRHRDE